MCILIIRIYGFSTSPNEAEFQRSRNNFGDENTFVTYNGCECTFCMYICMCVCVCVCIYDLFIWLITHNSFFLFFSRLDHLSNICDTLKFQCLRNHRAQTPSLTSPSPPQCSMGLHLSPAVTCPVRSCSSTPIFPPFAAHIIMFNVVDLHPTVVQSNA
jgi:hypothetical protein